MNYENLNDMIDTDYLRLVLEGVEDAYANRSREVAQDHLEKISDYAEENFKAHEMIIQMGLCVLQCRNGLNNECARIAKKLLKQLL
jgi:predicted metal-binding protein